MASEATRRAPPLDVAVDVAHDAGALLRARVTTETDYTLKSSAHDLVTDTDREAEALIVERLTDAFPDHGVVAEEESAVQLDARFRWVIDPIDGTTNFAHGIPFFSVSIALEDEGTPVLGVLYDPMHGEMFTSEKGQGAYLNGRPMRVSAVEKLQRAVFATGFPHTPDLRQVNLRNFERFVPITQGLRRFGSAALALAYVAAGRLDGYWDLDLNRWDLAAGVLLVSEAGGRITDGRGASLPYDAGDVTASNGRLHDELLTHLQGG